MLGASLMLAAGSAAPSTLLNGLVASWSLDGNGADDLGAANMSAQGTGAITWETGKLGQAARFGTGNRLQTADLPNTPPVVHPTSAFTFSAWIYPRTAWASLEGCRLLADFPGLTSLNRWLIFVNSGVLKFFVQRAGGSILNIGTTNPPLNAWTHIMGTADGSGIAYYFDNALAASASWGAAATYNASTYQITVGNSPVTGVGFNDGTIDSFQLWDRVLTSGERAELYNGGAGKAYPF